MTDLRIEDVPEDLRGRYIELNMWIRGPISEDTQMPAEIGLLSELLLIERIARLEAFAAKWATDAPLNERRTLHEASVAYRKAAGVFPNPDGVKAILDK